MDYNPQRHGYPFGTGRVDSAAAEAAPAYSDNDERRLARISWRRSKRSRRRDQRFEATGSPIITDGEQRVSSFATYPIADTLAGAGLASNIAPGGQMSIFRRPYDSAISGGPFRYNFYAGELVKKAVKMTNKPLHRL